MPPRGKILSRSGRPISRDTPIYRIYIVPEESDDIDGLIDMVAHVRHSLSLSCVST